MDPLLTTDDVAAFFRVDVVTVRRMISKGELTAYRVGGEYRFKQTDIDAYLERQRLPARQEPRGPLEKLTQRARNLIPSGVGDFSDRGTKGAFDHFTQRAANALVLAQEEAHSLRHQYLGTEHILLGLMDESDGVAARVLSELGVDLSHMRTAVESAVGRGEREVAGEICLTRRAKKVLELAAEEARRLGHHHIGTEHLLLGLLCEGDGAAAMVLGDLSIELGMVRSRVQEMLALQKER